MNRLTDGIGKAIPGTDPTELARDFMVALLANPYVFEQYGGEDIIQMAFDFAGGFWAKATPR